MQAKNKPFMTWKIFKNLPTANRSNFDSISPTNALNFAWSVKHRTQWHCLYCASQLSERIKFSLVSFNIRLGDRRLPLAIFYYASSFCFLLSVSHHVCHMHCMSVECIFSCCYCGSVCECGNGVKSIFDA